MKSTHKSLQRLSLAILCGAALPLAAQTGPAPSEETSLDEDVYILSPFEVRSDDTVGYLATQTLAGTRIRTDLKDVGSALSVVTEEFMTDVGATDNTTLLQFTTNAEVAGTRGTYSGLGNGTTLDESANLRSPAGAQRVRGLASADNTRDFFITDIPWDGFIANRIDIQRGPNSILFGLGSPAGIINASIDSAEFYDIAEASVRVGSYGSMRGSVDINRVLIKDTLAVRVEGLWDHEQFKQDPAYEDDERVFAAFRYSPKLFKAGNARTVIKGNYENGKIDANRPRNIPPYDSITPWFKSYDGDGNWTINSGMGKRVVTNPYDVQREESDDWSIPEGDVNYGMAKSSSPNYQPWLSSVVNQQQPLYFIDGSSGTISSVLAGYMNMGALNPDGSMRGAGDGLYGKQYGDQFYQLTGLSSYALNADLPMSGSGQYRNAVLTDPKVFDFYNKLIDGENKWEKEDWEAYNFDITQSFFDDRIALQLSYDKQRYERSNNSLIGGSPAITMDIQANLAYYYTGNSDGGTNVSNPNFGRPYVTTASYATGSSYESDRENVRGSLFAEFRVSDVTENDFLVKLFGKHRFNAVMGRDRFYNEKSSWYNTSNSLAWTSYWTGTDGMQTSYWERPAVGVIYLGSSIADRASASGANISNIGSKVALVDSQAYVFDSTWTATGVNPGDAWSVPAKLGRIYNTVPEDEGYWTQASNPANYQGWTYKNLDIDTNFDGKNKSLTSAASKALRQVDSIALSWQGYFWNDALVTTIGWRNDRVKDKDVQAGRNTLNRSYLNLSPDVFKLPDEVSPNQIFEDDSMSYGAVLHLNQILDNDPLPINVSLSYNESENFQITSTRRDVYGEILGNPSGKTEDYGVMLSTKDNRFSLRIVKFKTTITNATSSLSNSGGIGSTIQQGLRFRNVFLYDLSGYTYDGRESPSYRNTWTNTYSDRFDPDIPEQAAAAQAEEDAAIRAWNDIQEHLTPTGFFEAWNFSPVPLQYLTDRSTYESTLSGKDPASQYLPPDGTVVTYAATAPQGFSVTEDTESKGYEFELTANPTSNWRISFNASQTEATRRNVGGKNLSDMIEYLDSMFLGSNGDLLPAALLPQWGNAGLTVYKNVYQPFRSQYSQLKLTEGTATPEIRKWRFNLVTNYAFTDGALKGFSVGAGYRWQDKVAIGYPVVEEGPNMYGFDLKHPVYGPEEDAIDVWAGYERALTDKINWRIQVNVRNLGAGDELIPISLQADGKTPAAYRIAPCQEWFVTNTFSF